MLGDHAEQDVAFELCPIEGSQGTFKILQYSLLYADNHILAGSNPDSQWLVQAFDMLTKHYPITLGHRVQLPDKSIIVVSQEDRMKQRVYQHSENLSVAEFDEIKYRHDVWPPTLKQLLSEQTANIECLISAAITRLKNGYLITLSVSHIVADAAGVAVLLQQWASLAKQLFPGGSNSHDNVLPKLPVDFDHPALVSSPDYVGNGVSTAYVSSTIAEIIEMPVIELAHKIKPIINSLTPGAAVHMAEAICDTENMFAVKAIYISSIAASHMTISNASRMPFYDIDFGLGKPEAVLWGSRPTEGMSSWLPNKDGGVVINFGLKDNIYNALKRDIELNDFVSFAN
ncbi:hypothetical protein GGF49_004892 [Coemansia sp. RSA 1853]|nr:hypothetical protein GGF49_004892 [Coemansia sp. RSA 1853]